MTKPVFGKWTSVKDQPVPKDLDVIVIEKGMNSSYMGIIEDEEEGLRWDHNEWTQIEDITHWMPAPENKPEQDAFTELRALLDKYEKNANEGKLQQFDDGMLFVIKKIREVVE